MAVGEALDLVARLNLIYGGDSAFNRAANSMKSLADRTASLQKVAGDVSGFQKSNSSIEALSKSIEENRAKLNQNAPALEAAKKKSRELSAAHDTEKAKLIAMRGQVSKSSKEYKDQAAKVKELAAAQKQAETESKILSENQRALTENVSQAERAIEKERARLSEFERGLTSAGVNVNNLAGMQDRLTAAVERSQNAQAKLKGIRENLTFESVEQKIIKPAMTAYAAISPFVSIAGDFEAAMARVKAVSFSAPDANLEDFKALTEQARELGAATQFTSIQAAQSMENLARAGMSAKDIAATMPALLDMAAAEGMGLEEAAGILASVQSGMNMLASDSNRIADILAYTSGASKTSISTLGEALKVAAPSAAALNIRLEEMAGLLGVLGNKGFEGSEAGNALSSAFTRLSQTNTQKVLNSLGVAVKTEAGQMRQLPDILKALNDAFDAKNLGEVERIAYMSEIFGQNYGKQMLALASDVEGIKKIEAGAFTDAAGRSKTMANINLDTLNGQFTLLSSAFDGFKMKLGDAFAPAVRAGVELLSKALSGLTEIMNQFPGLTQAAAYGFMAFTGFKVLNGVMSISKSLLSLPGALVEISRAGREVAGLAGNFAGVAQSAGELSGVFSNLFGMVKSGAVLAFGGLQSIAIGAFNVILAHPFIAGVALLGGVLLLIKNWEKVKAAFGAVCDWCGKKWGALCDWWASFSFPDIWGGLKSGFISVCEEIKGVWQSVCDFFSSLNPFKGAGEAINNAIKTGGAQQVKNANAAVDMWGPPMLYEAHATGGIFTRPHVGVVAEDGPEAIIPLRDPARGVPLVLEAAQELGMLGGGERENISGGSGFNGRLSSGAVNNRSVRESFSPVINISVQSSENSSDLAGLIASKVREVLENLSSVGERVSYA